MQANERQPVFGAGNHPRRREYHPHALLEIYFNSEHTLGEKSSMGPMIQRLETYGEKKRACSKCKGEGVIETKEFVDWKRRKEDYDGGLLTLLYDGAEGSPRKPFESLRPPPPMTAVCWRCKGACEVYARKAKPAEVTAWPTGSSEDITGVQREPDYDQLLTLASASRCMLRLGRERGQSLVKALTAYHGRAGDWCQAHLGNRVFAVAALDPVVERTLRSNADTEAALKTLRGWASNPDRADAWALIEARAERLVAHATRAWSEVCRGQ